MPQATARRQRNARRRVHFSSRPKTRATFDERDALMFSDAPNRGRAIETGAALAQRLNVRLHVGAWPLVRFEWSRGVPAGFRLHDKYERTGVLVLDRQGGSAWVTREAT